MPERSSFEECWSGGEVPSAEEPMAAERLAFRYFKRMVELARWLIRRYGLQAVTDAEDAANVALYQLFKAAAQGGPREPESGDGLWKLARLLVVRKVLRARRRSNSIKRGGSGKSEGESAGGQGPMAGQPFTRVEIDFEGLQSRHVSSEDVVVGTTEVEHLIEKLGDPILKKIVRMRLEGNNAREIAEKTKLDRSSVARKLEQIRMMWSESGLEP